jgi:GNAT superfamily N-acetyltransferase
MEKLPKLTEELISQIIFSMENQQTEHLLDLKEGVIIEKQFIDEEDKSRYLELPTWSSADGFKTMEKFTSTVRNPIYKNKLRDVLQSGKGVFRNFKDVLHQQPQLEKLWYDYKDREIKKRVVYWYKMELEIESLTSLGLDTFDEFDENLIKEDFIFSDDGLAHLQEIRVLQHALIDQYKESEDPKERYLAFKIKEAFVESEDDEYLTILTSTGQFAGFIRYLIDEQSSLAIVRCFMIKKEFQGLGLFKYLFEKLMTLLNEYGVKEIIVELVGESLKVAPMFEFSEPENLTHSVAISVDNWCDKVTE